jgi:hypothetical protein
MCSSYIYDFKNSCPVKSEVDTEGRKRYSSTHIQALERGKWWARRPGRFTSYKETRCSLCRGLGGLGAGLDGSGNVTPTRLRTPFLPARNESLHRLHYPRWHLFMNYLTKLLEAQGNKLSNCRMNSHSEFPSWLRQLKRLKPIGFCIYRLFSYFKRLPFSQQSGFMCLRNSLDKH